MSVAGQTLTFQKKYEYVGTEKVGDKTLDKIKSKTTKAELKQDPNVDVDLKLVKSDVKVESSDATILFDREAGHVVNCAGGSVRIKGDNLTFSFKGTELAARSTSPSNPLSNWSPRGSERNPCR